MDRQQVAAIQAVQALFLQPLSYIYEDDDEDLVLRHLTGKRRRSRRALIPRIEGYVERTIPTLLPDQFKEHFRMLPSTFDTVLREISDELTRRTNGNEMISPSKQFLLSLWRMATPDSYRSIWQRFNVGKATAIRSVRRVALALCRLAKRYIQWPQGDRIQSIKTGFYRTSAFPDIIGAIDGTHINIPAPKDNPESYVNRKGHHSIQLQAVCDHSRLFTHIYVGHVGSVHDARVFRLSEVHDYLGHEDKFPNDSHLVGDAAYGLHERLLVPYTDNGHLTLRQKNFNFCLSSGRITIERAFALLKGRWRSLLHCTTLLCLESKVSPILLWRAVSCTTFAYYREMRWKI